MNMYKRKWTDMPKRDLAGQKYGMLTVIRRAEQIRRGRTHWVCRCDCGSETIVEQGHLLDGHTKSCGCYRRIQPKTRIRDLTGQRFGRLVALKPVETKEKGARWLCRCDCGKERVCTSENLVSGKTKSCGCLVKAMRKDLLKRNIHFIEGTCVERISSRERCSNNTSGQRGVYRKGENKWRALIGFQGKVHNLGTFSRFEDAVKARLTAEEELYDRFLDQLSQKKEDGTKEMMNEENTL